VINPARQLDLSKIATEKSMDLEKHNVDVPKPMPKGVRMVSDDFTARGQAKSPQYTMAPDGSIHLPHPIYQKPEHILTILNHLQNSPLGFSTSLPNQDISITDGNVTLSPSQWDIVKDCVTVVHYMNDFSTIGPIEMYSEARASWIRMFGWAPGIDEMIQAKQRANEFREEKGRHITALGTKAWIGEMRVARERGECAVWKSKGKNPPVEKGRESSVAEQKPMSGPVWGVTFEDPAFDGNESEMVVLKAAVNHEGKAFLPKPAAKQHIWTSMAAHTITPASLRKDSVTTSTPKRKTQVIDISQDSDDEETKEEETFTTFPSTINPRPAQEEQGKQGNEKLPSHLQMLGSLVPAKDPIFYPSQPSSSIGTKRPGSPSLMSSETASKRQSMGQNSQAELVGKSGLSEYMIWEEERNRHKKLEREARAMKSEGRVIDERDIEVNSS
jgi:hypothetical protein